MGTELGARENKRLLGREWRARTKRDLIIEVWEALDCESVGAKELEAIAEVVRARFGEGAVESPAAMARILAEEGADLRHAEVLECDVRWRLRDPYAPMFRHILKFGTFAQAAASIRQLENLRRKFARARDREGLRRVREVGIKGKRRAEMIARNRKVNAQKRAEKEEIARWFAVWLTTPEIFERWLELRLNSEEFRARFGAERAVEEER
ncbi:hypothetical protein [Pyrinomonas methylaliphatogenes]|uniref:Uncharacterized protein n=1 Tax=Pyrinomonas methylaliphatogenes TaxID=454194 RepID=A0A0B6WY30_9BACT|nr:hypothetical protein [Pyrinomonas methylaliphatogenes]MBX5478168.1 hypothetical protein [Pyrinomonas methylaliphatogenes]CDM65617.1 hypothetical protein PYK22_01622 [Pyrinomonas methylaliphatogenes]